MSDCQIMSNIARVPDKWVATWVKMVPGRPVGPVLLRLTAIILVKSKGSEKKRVLGFFSRYQKIVIIFLPLTKRRQHVTILLTNDWLRNCSEKIDSECSYLATLRAHSWRVFLSI